jgi:ATP-dependent helicase HrpA
MFADVKKAVEHCLIRDRHSVREALKRIRKLPEDQQADKLAPLLERVKSSQAIAGLRETMPALNYPENLPVSERCFGNVGA